MAEEYSFFNDVEYDADEFAQYFKQFLSSGLYHTNNAPALQVTHVSGMQTKMVVGSAYLEGFMYRNTEDIIFAHDPADATNARIDRVVLRLDRNLSARYIKAFIKKGVSATNPQPPALQRDDIVYEISLSQVRINAGTVAVASVTDERLDPSVAGLVTSLITIPTEQFQAQWDAWFTGIKNEIGVRVLIGVTEPTGVIPGDIWMRSV